MTRIALTLLLLCLSLSTFAAATVTVNGKTVAIPVIETNGKAYVDVQALMKAVGGTATYDAKTHKVAVTTSTAGSGASGTAQLAGDNGEFGKLYSIRKDVPLFFTLLRAEYTTEQVAVGDRTYVPAQDEKLLVLHFTVQNPNKTDSLVRSDSLRFMAVDAKEVNHNGELWGDEETKARLDMMLKPAQKIAGYTVISVPASGVVPKLMVQPAGYDNGPVLRYDLRGKVTALKAPIADPADATGATALVTVPAVMHTAYPMKEFDLTVEKTEFATATMLDNYTAKNGERFLLVNITANNNASMPDLLRSDTFKAFAYSADGEEFRMRGLLFATSDRRIDQMVPPSNELRGRIYFVIPKGVTLTKFTVQEDKSRVYAYEFKE